MRQFLEGEMWKDGERKVWLEAHLVGGEMECQRATFILLNGEELISEDEESEGGEEFDSLGDLDEEEQAPGAEGNAERIGE
jgi:hypothetical protein